VNVVVAVGALVLISTSLLAWGRDDHQGRLLQSFDSDASDNNNNNKHGNETNGSWENDVRGDSPGIAVPMVLSFLGLGAGAVVTHTVIRAKQRRSGGANEGGNHRNSSRRSGTREGRRRKTAVTVDSSTGTADKPRALVRPPSGNSLVGGFLGLGGGGGGSQRNRRETFDSPRPSDQWGLRLVPTPGKGMSQATSLMFASRTAMAGEDAGRSVRLKNTQGLQREESQQDDETSKSLALERSNSSEGGKYKSRYMHHVNLKWRRKATPMSSAKSTTTTNKNNNNGAKVRNGFVARLAGDAQDPAGNASKSVRPLPVVEQESVMEECNDSDGDSDGGGGSRVESMRRLSTHTPKTLLTRKSTMSMVFSQLVGMTHGNKKDRVSEGTMVLCSCKRSRRPVEYDALTMKQLRHVCRLRGINPGGSHDALVCKLMISRKDLGLATCRQCLLNMQDLDRESDSDDGDEVGDAGDLAGDLAGGVDLRHGMSMVSSTNRTSSLRSPWRPSRLDASFSELV
jgi:hypothetical protein